MQRLRYKCSPQELRRREYPDIRDQLDAMVKLAAALREQGIPLPDDVVRWVEHCQAVKRKYPKPEAPTTEKPA